VGFSFFSSSIFAKGRLRTRRIINETNDLRSVGRRVEASTRPVRIIIIGRERTRGDTDDCVSYFVIKLRRKRKEKKHETEKGQRDRALYDGYGVYKFYVQIGDVVRSTRRVPVES